MDQGFDESAQTPGAATYDLTLPALQALAGTTRLLTRNGKRLEVKIPSGTRDGQTVRLANALRVTDGGEGDILIRVHVESSPESATVQTVSDATFEAEVLKSPLPVFVDFWAPWCGPCRALAPLTEQLAKDYAGRMKFCKLNVDENPLASRKYQVASIPTMIFFRQGQIADVSVGAAPAQELRRRVDAVLARH